MSYHLKGYLITFEGTEGAGKSTLIYELKRLLDESVHFSKYTVNLTREPGGTPLSETLRDLILNHPMTRETELLLYEAARAEHVHQVILPALKRGELVLCDRFTDSSLAYQGYARGIPLKLVERFNQFATFELKPDLTVFLDINPETGLTRAKDHNRFEAEGVAFQKKVRQGFLNAKKLNPKRWFVLKVKQQSPTELAQSIVKEMEKRFKRGRRSV